MKKWLKTVYSNALIVVLLGAFQSVSAGVFPGSNWAEATPESQGIDSTKLDAAMTYLKGECGRHGVTQTVVIRNGYMIWKGTDTENKHNVWSVSKSFTSTALGLLIDEGKATLDTKAKDFVGILSSTYPNVSLRHFATMTSGYNANGGDQTSTPFEPSNSLFSPGTKFEYWDAAMNQFGNVLTQIADEPLQDLFKREIADPIGMNMANWSWGNWGTLDGHLVNGGAGNKSKGIHITTRELARFGLLFLNRGQWDGQQ
ncbi:hypothetical protein BVX98_03285, partial [bacterium F11]